MELAKANLATNETHNVFGVVLDATFPYKNTGDKYICSMKIVDPSLHVRGVDKSGGKTSGADLNATVQHKEEDDHNEYATVIIYGLKFESLPITVKIGDIVRLHRATLRMY